MTRPSLCMIPPLFAYHVVNPRGGAVATPWYLSGGVSAANCIAAYQPIGAADYAASKVNLANPGTYNATDGAAYPTWDATNGWKLVEASSQYLETNIMPTATTSAIVRFSNALTVSVLIGSYSGNNTTRFYIAPNNNNNHVYEHAGSTGLVSPAYSSGVMAIAGQEGFYNGEKDDDIPGTWSGSATKTLRIGNQNGFSSYCDAYIQALAIYSVTITAEQVAAITTAMNALTSESRVQSLEGLLDFEAEEEKLWWEGADLVEAAAQAIEAPELTWWQKANNVASDAIGKAKKWMDDKLYQLWQAIEDYFDYKEE